MPARRIVEACEPPPCEPPRPPPLEPAVTLTYAHYLERENLEDRVEFTPRALEAADALASRSSKLTPPSSPAEPHPNPFARLGQVLPVEHLPRRDAVETIYRLRVATTRSSGVLDVMG